ncbi:hypothetical protein TNCV_4753831 [Trichonephila clavipes]|nr:hypothetical protein TNCV_4753831 [Trichonephila clavipes]
MRSLDWQVVSSNNPASQLSQGYKRVVHSSALQPKWCHRNLTLEQCSTTPGLWTAITRSDESLIHVSNMCNYSPTNRALISKKGPERILIRLYRVLTSYVGLLENQIFFQSSMNGTSLDDNDSFIHKQN